MSAVVAINRRADLLGRIAGAAGMEALQAQVPVLHAETLGAENVMLRAEVVTAFKARFKALGGGTLKVAALERLFPSPKRTRARAVAPGELEFTELGATERLFRRVGDHTLYAMDQGAFYSFDGLRWAPQPSGDVLGNAAEEVLLMMKEEALRVPDPERQQDLVDAATQLQRVSVVNGMVRRLQGRVACTTDEFNVSTQYLVVANGTVDLETGELMPSQPEHRLTMAARAAFVPDAPRATWEQTLNDVFQGDTELVAFFKRLIGYSLLGNPKERILVVMPGVGKNGKSTVFNVLQEVLGEHAAKMSSQTVTSRRDDNAHGNSAGPREDLLRLRGKRFVLTSEIKQGTSFNDEVVKDLASGGDTLVARGVHGRNSVEFKPTCVVFCPTNVLPAVPNDDQAVWDRLVPLPFNTRFDLDSGRTPDLDRPAKLREEIDGILAWAVEGALEYQRVGLRVPAKLYERRDAMRHDDDYLALFMEEVCEVAPSAQVGSVDITDEYNEFLQRHGSKVRYSTKTMKRLLEGRGFKYGVLGVPPKQRRGFRGIGLRGTAPVAPWDEPREPAEGPVQQAELAV